MNDLMGRRGRAILNEIRSMKAPKTEDVRLEADACMQRITENSRYARKSISAVEKEQAVDELRDVDLYVKRLYERVSDNEIAKEDIEYLRYKLHVISDSYADFEIGLLAYATKSGTRLRKIICYLVNHPEVKSSDVIEYVSSQPDFWEDV